MKKFLILAVTAALLLVPFLTLMPASAADLNDSVANYITKTLKATHYYNFKTVGDYNDTFANGKDDLAAKSKAFLNLATGKYDAVLRNGIRAAGIKGPGPVVVAEYQGSTGNDPFAAGGKRTLAPTLKLQNPEGTGGAPDMSGGEHTMNHVEILSEVFNKNVLDNNSITVSYWVKQSLRATESASPRTFAFGQNNTLTLFSSAGGNNHDGGGRRAFVAAKDAANGTSNFRPFNTEVFETDVWVYITYIIDGKANDKDRLQMYVNGVKMTNAPAASTIVIKNLYDAEKTHYHIGIGQNESGDNWQGTNFTHPFNGELADFAIFDYALSAAQATALYNIALNGDPSYTGGGTTPPATTKPGTTAPPTGDMTIVFIVMTLVCGAALTVFKLRRA